MDGKKSKTFESDIREKYDSPLATELRARIPDAKSANELKEYLGVTIQAINQYKLGTAYPKTENLIKIADYFGISVDWLLGRPNSVRTINGDVAAIHEFTGLSEKAIELLHSLRYSPQGKRAHELGVGAKGYNIGHIGLLNELIESNYFLELMNEIGFFMIYGEALPDDAYSTPEEELSSEEYERFWRWTNDTGREIVPRRDIRDLHLQLACDRLKDICKDILDKEIKLKEDADNA